MRLARPVILAAFAALAAGSAHAAMSVEEAEGIVFISHDRNGDSTVTPRELEQFRSLAFAAMDADRDARISGEEWEVFDPGFLNVAIESGRTMELADAKGETFARYDVSADGYLSNDEMTAGVFRDFVAADADDDGRLTLEEMRDMALVMVLSASLQ